MRGLWSNVSIETVGGGGEKGEESSHLCFLASHLFRPGAHLAVSDLCNMPFCGSDPSSDVKPPGRS